MFFDMGKESLDGVAFYSALDLTRRGRRLLDVWRLGITGIFSFF